LSKKISYLKTNKRVIQIFGKKIILSRLKFINNTLY